MKKRIRWQSYKQTARVVADRVKGQSGKIRGAKTKKREKC